ncbi:chemokine-like factor [Amblyraja radiata]|uniref:chemokine-like factor n=1 Tax=Amblyraja radiata TaxID=386614 RepID=UPI0014041BF5|nr:chemokine-like factor [Amblyraja radiata]
MPDIEVNFPFVKSKRSVLKILEMVVAFVAFVCFAASSFSGAFLAVPLMEIFITLAFYLLYLLKLDSKITQLFWPLMDSVNSAFAGPIPAGYLYRGPLSSRPQRESSPARSLGSSES